MIRIEIIDPEETYPLRREELRKNMDLSHKMEGDFDSETLHVGLFVNDRLACIGSFMRSEKKDFVGAQYQLRGMATSSDFQGMGYGSLLLTKAENMLREMRIETLWCNARETALDFYKKMGYKTVGAIFVVPQIGPHFKMMKEIRSS